MRRALSRLSDEKFDLLIIGGGITGACVARDASRRGLKVALIEKADFSAATSAHNSKLIHGGLRYLRNLEFGLVRESLRERRIWQRIAPHLVQPLPFLLPVHGSVRQLAELKTGLTVYDLLSFDRNCLDDPDERLPGHHWLSKQEALEREPVIGRSDLRGAFLYYDAQMYSPERLALECLVDADSHGAALANYVEATQLTQNNGRVSGCTARDGISGRTVEIQARLTLVAAGPWADIFLDKVLGKKSATRLIRSKGIHLLTRPITHDCALTMAARTGHFFVMPWREQSLIGTTDTVFDANPDDLGVSAADMDAFLKSVNLQIPEARLGRRDVAMFYAGLRPLVDDGSGDSYHASRRAELVDHGRADGAEGLLSAVGGKWTTSRALAEKVTDRIISKLGCKADSCTTASSPLPGGKIRRWSTFVAEITKQYPTLQSNRHLLHMLGTQTPVLVNEYGGDTNAFYPLGPTSDVPAQIRHAIRSEMALTLEDVVMRRTSIGQVGQPDRNILDAIAEIMAGELGWTEARRDRELAAIAPNYALQEAV